MFIVASYNQNSTQRQICHPFKGTEACLAFILLLTSWLAWVATWLFAWCCRCQFREQSFVVLHDAQGFVKDGNELISWKWSGLDSWCCTAASSCSSRRGILERERYLNNVFDGLVVRHGAGEIWRCAWLVFV